MKSVVAKRISLNSLWLLVAHAAGQGLMLLFTVLAARYLGEAGLGQYAFITAVIYLANVFTTFGMDTLLIREIAGLRRTDTPSLTAALLIQLALSLLFITGILLGGGWLPNQTTHTLPALKLVSFSLIPLAFSTVYSAALRAFERMV